MKRPGAVEGLLALAGLAAILLSHGLGPSGRAAWAPTERGPGLVRVATWNVGGSLAAGAPALRDGWVAPLAERLRSLDLDLLLLQEVEGRGQLARFVERLGSDWSAVSRRGDGRRVAVLARGGELAEVRTGDRSGRVLLVEWSGSLGRFAVGALHASATSSRARHAAVLDLLAAVEGSAAEFVILGGDLNLDVTLDGRADLFTDDERRDVDAYARMTAGFTDLGLGAGPTAEPDRRLDYLFASESLECSSAGPVCGLREPEMDHDPVVADLRAPQR